MRRTKESSKWKEFTRFELPNGSLSPTMCIQGGELFYAYLQSSEVKENGKAAINKKVVINKHPLNPAGQHHILLKTSAHIRKLTSINN